MQRIKRPLSVVAAVLAVIGILICLIITWFSWSLNTPVTESLVQISTGAERVLTASSAALNRVDEAVSRTRAAVTTVEEATTEAGETIVETNIAFLVLERTVGDTLFPRIVSAHETVTALADLILGINESLEAANRLPFVSVPTLTEELNALAERLAEARARVEEIRDGLRAIKEEKVGRPVSFITDRTGTITENLDAALTIIGNARALVDMRLAQVTALKARIPGLIDLISVLLTLIMIWLIAVQGYVLVHAYEFLTGKKIDWSRLRPKSSASQPETD